VEQILIDVQNNQIHMSFESKLQLRTTKTVLFLWCNFLEKSPEEFVGVFLFQLLSPIGCKQTMTFSKQYGDERTLRTKISF
jgi:hypothetical protein